MEKPNSESTHFDEVNSLQVIREMIAVSRNNMNRDGILFIVWGWSMFLQYVAIFLSVRLVTTYTISRVLKYTPAVLIAASLILTAIYLFRHRHSVKTYIGMSLRYIWISVFACMVLVNIILFNVLEGFRPEVQHPVFMVLIAFAIVVSGSVLRYAWLIAGGIIFAILALTCSYLVLQNQVLLEALAWFLAFVIPGHILYARRKLKENV